MAKIQKTNAMRFLETKKIEYTVNSYQCDEFIDGVTMAREIGQPIEETYKTLVAQGKSREYYCFVIPCAAELDLKAAAASVGEKSVELIAVKDITKVTAYKDENNAAAGFTFVLNNVEYKYPYDDMNLRRE